jgi:hypothetical protein
MSHDFRILIQKNYYGDGVYIRLIVNNVRVCQFVVLNKAEFFERLIEVIELAKYDSSLVASNTDEQQAH